MSLPLEIQEQKDKFECEKAIWVAENLQNDLGLSDKASEQWTAAEVNTILMCHLVSAKNGGTLFTFGRVEWESDSYRGIMRSRCYPFDLPGHRFHGMNLKVKIILSRCICRAMSCLWLIQSLVTGLLHNTSPFSVHGS
jgi:hypothetical protein